MVVLEGDQPLGDAAHRYYDGLVKRLEHDTKHVQHVQNYWGDLITAAGVQSTDGKGAYVMVNLVGDVGSTASIESVAAIRQIVAKSDPPAGIKAYVTGQAPLTADNTEAADASMVKITIITLIAIAVMLLVVYRSITTSLLVLFVVVIEMNAARGVVAVFTHTGILGLSVFATELLTSLAIAAGTDYAIFLIGRYQEARQSGQDREDAYYTAFHGVGHVILGSGLTVAGAMLCLHFTRLNYFSSMGIPSAIALSVVVAAALTLAPAMLVLGSRFGVFETKRVIKTRGWRRVGTVVVRWPVPIFVAATALALVGLLAVPGYEGGYNDRRYIPADVPSNIGYAAAERHFTAARMNPDILLVDAGRDLRNVADMIVLDQIAKKVFEVPGIARVQSITRPLGDPIAHSSIPFQVSLQSVSMRENIQFVKARFADMLRMSDQLGVIISTLTRMHELTGRMADTTHRMLGNMHDIKATTDELRDHFADFDDFFRPLRNYFYWEPHCIDIPICWSVRSLFDGLDGVDKLADNFNGVDKLADNFNGLLANVTDLDQLMPQMVALLPPMISVTTDMQATIRAMYSTFSGMIDQIDRMTDTASVMGQAFDDAKNGDHFYLPPEAFDSPDFQRGLKLLVSPDGKSAQFIITHDGDPATRDGISHVGAKCRPPRRRSRGLRWPMPSSIWAGRRRPTRTFSSARTGT
jgi:RND superfamily putative drug exporter